MDDRMIVIALRVFFIGTLFIPFFPWPKPKYATELVATESLAPTIFLLIFSIVVAFYAYCWYENQSELVVLRSWWSQTVG